MTAAQAATRLYHALRANDIARAAGVDDLVVLTTGAEAPTVVWESGPFEWAVCLTGGDSLVASELDSYGGKQEANLAQVLAEVEAAGLFFEPVNGFTLAAYRA